MRPQLSQASQTLSIDAKKSIVVGRWSTNMAKDVSSTLFSTVIGVICQYCSSPLSEGELKCQNCGAPVISGDADSSSDFRTCPFCHRKLLALASPACNYCGRRLPESYIKAREADFRRVAELNEGERETETADTLTEIFSRGGRSKRGGLSLFGLDVDSFFDRFS